MTDTEKLDLLIMARSALKTAILFAEQALGASEALADVGELPTLKAIDRLRTRIVLMGGAV